MPTQPKTFLTPEQYLEIERKAEYKSEYYRGEMFAMAGAKESHNLLVAHLVRSSRLGRSEAVRLIDEVLAPFGARFSPEAPFRPVHIRGIFADDASSTVIVLWDGAGTTTIGTTYETRMRGS